MAPPEGPSGRGLARATTVLGEYPRQFWILVGGTFIDRLGGALLFPFFTLYITARFGVGMTQVGLLFGVFALSSAIGTTLGGALTDRLGRKRMFLFGLVASALSSVVMGLVDSLALFVGVVVLVGILADAGFPAQQAMVADLLPEEKRGEGFGILRVVVNLAVTIGPMIGGLLAARSYLSLFLADAVTSLVTAAIVFLALKESRPAPAEGVPAETMARTFAGYLDVLRNRAFAWFLVTSILMILVYMQMNTTLAVYLRDSHGIPAQGFGYLLSLNGAMVVLFQFPIARWARRFRPLLIMTTGTLLYAIGFGLYGFVGAYTLFVGAMAIITVGEMLVSPTGQAIVASMAPGDMRGRYMATFGYAWLIPSAIGPLVAGLVMDYADPRWVWYGAGILGLAAAGGYYLLERRAQRAMHAAIDRRLEIVQALEEGTISADEAATEIEAVEEDSLVRLAPSRTAGERRYVRLRTGKGAAGVDLRLPRAIVNTALHTGGRLSAGLDSVDPAALRLAIAGAAADTGTHIVPSDSGEVEVSVESD